MTNDYIIHIPGYYIWIVLFDGARALKAAKQLKKFSHNERKNMNNLANIGILLLGIGFLLWGVGSLVEPYLYWLDFSNDAEYLNNLNSLDNLLNKE